MNRHESNWLKACDLLAPLFSTCSRKQYFSVVLAPNRRVAGIGYNGSPPGMKHCDQGGCPHADDGLPSGSQYENCISQHAEMGALLWSDQSLRMGGTIIVNGPPCFNCAKAISSSGLKRVVCYDDNAYPSRYEVYEFLQDAGITIGLHSRFINDNRVDL